MDTSKEKTFYESLGKVPQIPDGILENIERSAAHASVVRRGLIAACLCFTLITSAFIIMKIIPSPDVYADADDYEFMSELLYAFEYFNGDLDGTGYNYLIDDEWLY